MNEAIVNLPFNKEVSLDTKIHEVLLTENTELRKLLYQLQEKIKSLEKNVELSNIESKSPSNNVTEELLTDLSRHITLEKTIKSDKKVTLTNLKSDNTSYELSINREDNLDNRIRSYVDIMLKSMKDDPIMYR